jgi:hypothetical protein
MLDWIGETILVSALSVAEDSPNFTAIRALFGLLLIVIVVYSLPCDYFAPPSCAVCSARPPYATVPYSINAIPHVVKKLKLGGKAGELRLIVQN